MLPLSPLCIIKGGLVGIHLVGVKPLEEWTREELKAKQEENRRNGLHLSKGIPKGKQHKDHIGIANKGRKHPLEYGQAVSERNKLRTGKVHHRPECIEKMKQTQTAKREHYRQKALEQWQKPEIRQKQVTAIIEASHMRPNGQEQLVGGILQKVCPDQYEYTGDGGMVIDGMSPDFTNRNGAKKVIDFFGKFWHSERITGKDEWQERADRIRRFARQGYACLIIESDELKNKERLMVKIKAFHKRDVHRQVEKVLREGWMMELI